MRYLLLFSTLTVILSSCSFSSSSKEDEIVIDWRDDYLARVNRDGFDRYILYKGNPESDVEAALKERGTTYKMTWTVRTFDYKGFNVVHLTDCNYVGITEHNDMAIWFINPVFEPVTMKEGDLAIAIGIDPEGKDTYFNFTDKAVNEAGLTHEPNNNYCDAASVLIDNDKAVLSACYPHAISAKGYPVEIPDFETALKKWGIDLDELTSPEVEADTVRYSNE